jgi:molybdopterin adenylyltransferase
MSAALPVAVVTFSDTRTKETDTGGALVRALLTAAGHVVVHHMIVREDVGQVRSALTALLGSAAVAVVTTGGTGIAPRDVAIDVLEDLFDKKLDGFGEAFRRLSWDQVGVRSILSRAIAGTVDGKLFVALSGSEKAVRLGMETLVLPMLPHAVALLSGSSPEESGHHSADSSASKKT